MFPGLFGFLVSILLEEMHYSDDTAYVMYPADSEILADLANIVARYGDIEICAFLPLTFPRWMAGSQ